MNEKNSIKIILIFLFLFLPTFCFGVEIWEKIGETILEAPASSVVVSNLPSSENLIIEVYSAGVSIPEWLKIRFNGDTGNNYSRSHSFLGGVASWNSGESRILLNAIETAYEQYFKLNVLNVLDRVKLVSGTGVINLVGTVESAGSWNNTAEQISEVAMITQTAENTFLAGSRLTIYGVISEELGGNGGLSEIYEKIQNENYPTREFYVQKTLTYGEGLIIWFMTLFLILAITKTVFGFFWKK